jgi:hypothetical protein
MNPATRLGPLGQIARSVKDIEQSESWYRDALGLQHLYTFGSFAHTPRPPRTLTRCASSITMERTAKAIAP